MKKTVRRLPKGYDGPKVTTHHAGDVASLVMRGVAVAAAERPELVLATWPTVVGPHMAPMAQAVSFVQGVLWVRVKNSTVNSLLSQREKPRLLAALRRQLPNTTISDIVFRMS